MCPQVLAARSVDDRRELRRENYRRFLEGEERVIDLTRVRIQGGCIGAPPYENEGLKAAIEGQTGYKVKLMSRYPGGICVVLDAPGQVDGQLVKSLQKRVGGGEVIIVTTGTMKGVLSALTGPDGNDYPALLVDVDLDSMKATFKTRYMGEVRKVTFGRIRLDEEYREEARGRIWV
jgi:polynucleotide 5'-kinase involved in rRNA processing